jgi:hypothetical protein
LDVARRRVVRCAISIAAVLAAAAAGDMPAVVHASGTPTVTGVSPSSGPACSGTSLTVSGTNFSSDSQVQLRSGTTQLPAGNVQILSSTQLHATTPSLAAGVFDVIVSNASGSSAATAADRFTSSGAPSVTQPLNPSSGSVLGGNLVVITGANLLGATSVTFGGAAAASYSVDSCSQISATTPSGTGTVTVTVTVPGGSATAQFTYVAGLPAAHPNVSGVAPPGSTSGGTSVTVTGTGFLVPGSIPSVQFGSTPGSSVVATSDTQLTVVAPALCAGVYDVTVTTPGGTSLTSTADRYTANAGVPSISSISPVSGSNDAAQEVIVQGSELYCATAAQVGGVTASLASDPSHPNTAVEVAIMVPPAAGSTPPGRATVTTAGGTSAPSAQTYAWVAATPVISSLSTTVAPAAATITVTGSHFNFARSVLFGSTPSPSFTVNSSTQLTAVVPGGCGGSAPVTVSTDGGTSNTASFSYTVATPSVSGVSPSSGPSRGGNTVTVTGQHLTCATSVTFGSAAATGVQVASDTSLTAVAPANSTGIVDVRVADSAGTSAISSADLYTYAAPTVSSITPVLGAADGGTVVTITGTDFSNDSQVTFGGLAATTVTVLSGTSIRAVAPSHPAGIVDVVVATYAGNTVTITGSGFATGATVKFGDRSATGVTVVSDSTVTAVAPGATVASAVDVVVTTAGGVSQTSSSDVYLYETVPSVTAVAPAAGPTAGGATITVSGTDFVAGATVTVGGVAATNVTVVSPTQITATTPAHAQALVDVVVSTGGGASPVSAADRYQYEALPSLLSVSPNAGPLAGGTTITITGSNFFAGASVAVGSQAASNVTAASATSITATLPSVSSATTVDVVVTTAGGSSALSLQDLYAYGAPVVTGLSPVAGPLVGGTVVTVSGAQFVPGLTVSFGGTAGTNVSVLSATSLTVSAPAMPAGTVDVTITTAAGTSQLVSADRYQYDPIPTVTGVAPNAGALAGGNQVTLSGTGFVSGMSVKFGSLSGTSVTVSSSTSLTVTVPAVSTAATVDVTVTTPGGSSTTSLNDQYAYGAPTVSSISPNAGPIAGGTTVTVHGTSFVKGVAVKFGTVAATSVSVTSSTALTATSPSVGSATTVDLTVANPAGTSATSLQDLYAFGAPTVTWVSPNSSTTSGGPTVSVQGSGFVPGVSVSFSGTAGGAVSVSSSSQLTVQAPSRVGGVVDITVTNAAGTSPTSGADVFTYTPTITSISVNTGPTAGGTVVTVYGSGFNGVNQLWFGGSGAGFSVVNDGQLTTTSPPRVSGTIDIIVSTNGFRSPITGADQFTYQQGYWISSSAGAVYAFGSAQNYGSISGSLSQPIVAMAATPNGRGYWLMGRDGGIFTFGNAGFYGGGNQYTGCNCFVGIAPTPSGNGYWLVNNTGSIYTFGDAVYLGGGNQSLTCTCFVGIAPTKGSQGYWLVTNAGQVYTYGAATYHFNISSPVPVISIVGTPSNNGYWITNTNGQVYANGDAGYFGGVNATCQCLTGLATDTSGGGYVVLANWGGAFTYGDLTYFGNAPAGAAIAEMP